jgi:uncharacterized membrane protein
MVTPSTPRFDIGEALSTGWQLFLKNVGPMALYALVVFAISALVSVPTSTQDRTSFWALLVNVISFVVGQAIAIGWIRIALDAQDGRAISVDRITDSFRLLLPYIIAAILFSVGVTLGLILLIVPGIIFAVIFGFYGWIIVDKGERDAIAALRRSAEITRGERWRLFGFALLLILLNIVGLLLLVVGVLVTSAVSLLALGHVYRRLEASYAGQRPAVS